MAAFIFRRTVRIEWGDCDPAQIVFFPRYFAMCDASTHELFRAALGMRKSELVKVHGIVGVPMVDVRAKFMIPSVYGDDVVIESQMASSKRSSFEIAHRILKGDAVAVEINEIRVWAAPDAERPGGIRAREIPADVLAKFQV
jgi:4-hydroxybenzoyl-CoA thioesterase